jgi:DNA-directed RNA polymerase specialized sigma24 family protein
MTMTTAFYPPSPLLAAPSTRKLLTRYVARRVPACDVDDVVQATLCDALASGRAPDEAPDFQRWLLTIARFKVVDVHRAAARATPTEPTDVPAPPVPPAPVEALSLWRWAERQLPRGAEVTLRWMLREAEGDKLEAIAADESLPAERVRQRVSRLRRWMRERWVAELAIVAVLAVTGLGVLAATRRRYEAIVPEMAATGALTDRRLVGTWKLLSFTPAAPLPPARKAFVDRLAPGLTVTFDGRTFHAAGDGGFARDYAATLAGDGHIEAAETAVEGRRVSVGYAFDGDDLVVTDPAGRWAGVARFRPMR